MAQIDLTSPVRRFKMKRGASWNYKFQFIRQGTNEVINLLNLNILAYVKVGHDIIDTLTIGYGIEKSTDGNFFSIKKKWTTISIDENEVIYNPILEQLPLGIYIVEIILIGADGFQYFPIELEIEVTDESTKTEERNIDYAFAQIFVREGFAISISTITNNDLLAFSFQSNKLMMQIGDNPNLYQVFDFSNLATELLTKAITNTETYQNFVSTNAAYEGIIKVTNDDNQQQPGLYLRQGGKSYLILLQEVNDENPYNS